MKKVIINEAELEVDDKLPEPITQDVKGYKCKEPKTMREELIKDPPVREIPCTLPDEDQ